MGSGERNHHFSVFDGVKTFPLTPEDLMAEINSAVTNLEYVRATTALDSPSSSLSRNKGRNSPKYDPRMADEAYKVGRAALAAGKLDEAFHSFNVSLSKCPPDKASAVAKLQSLIYLTSLQLHKPPLSN